MGLRTNAKEMHYLGPVHQTLQGSPGVAGQESLAPAGEMMLPSSLLARERGGRWLTATGRGQHWHTTPGIQEGEAVHCDPLASERTIRMLGRMTVYMADRESVNRNKNTYRSCRHATKFTGGKIVKSRSTTKHKSMRIELHA